MKKFYVKDCPDSHVFSRWLQTQTDWLDAFKSVKPKRDYPWGLKFKIDNFNADQLTNDINEALSLYGDHPWQTAEGNVDSYTGFSLVYNPNHQDNITEPHSSTLGTPKQSAKKFYGYSDTYTKFKNSYYDSWAFCVPTPASQHKSIGELLNRTKRTKVRGRLSALRTVADKDGTLLPGYSGWHIDEPIYENLRINIPVVTTPNYMFEMQSGDTIYEEHLDVGYAYTWDTSVSHRVYGKEMDPTRRIHFVIGVSPWWDYLPEEDAWIQNEFYGVKHPFDMLADGDVFEGLTYIER